MVDIEERIGIVVDSNLEMVVMVAGSLATIVVDIVVTHHYSHSRQNLEIDIRMESVVERLLQHHQQRPTY